MAASSLSFCIPLPSDLPVGIGIVEKTNYGIIPKPPNLSYFSRSLPFAGINLMVCEDSLEDPLPRSRNYLQMRTPDTMEVRYIISFRLKWTVRTLNQFSARDNC